MKKQFSLSLFASVLAVLINYSISLFITPIITNKVGIEAYGFVSISKTFVSYAGIITIALTSFVVRYISINYHKKEFDEAKSYYSTAIISCVFVAAFLSLIFLVIIWKLEFLIKIPEDLVLPVKILFLLITINFAITTITTPFGAAVYIKERIDVAGIIKIIGYILEAVEMILLFSLCNATIWFVGIGALSFSLVNLLLNYIFTKKATPELTFYFSKVSFRRTKELIGNGIWNSINQLGNVLNSGLDLLISNLFLTSLVTGQIAVAKTLGTMAGAFEAMVYQTVQPSLIKSFSTEDKKTFVNKVKKTMKVCGLFCALIFSGFFALGKEYYTLWLPEQDSNVLHILTIITLVNHITDGVVSPLYFINTLTLKNKVPCWVTIAGGVLNVVSMYVLIRWTSLGGIAVVLTTAVIMVVINLTFNPIYSAKCISVPKRTFYPTIARHLVACLIMCGIFFLMKLFIHPTSWITLILTILLFTIIGSFIYILINFKFSEIKSFLKKKSSSES